jgi:hypothetical protein
MDQSFSIDSEITRQYRRFNATGTQLTLRLLPPPDDTDGDENTDFQRQSTDLTVALHFNSCKVPVISSNNLEIYILSCSVLVSHGYQCLGLSFFPRHEHIFQISDSFQGQYVNTLN